MNKKAIAILGAIFLLIVGTLGFLVYSKYSSKTPAPVSTGTNNATSTTSSNQNSNTTTTPVANNTSNIVKLSSDQVVSPVLFYDGTGITYFDTQGGLFKSVLQNSNGALSLIDKKKLDIPVKSSIQKILWPSQGKDFIAQMSDTSGKSVWSYFSGNFGTYTDLPGQIESLDWMPSGTQIVYVWVDNGKAVLSLANPDTKNFKKIADMWQNDNVIHVSPDGSEILYYESTMPLAGNSINSVSIDGKVWKGLIKNGQNFGALWSPDSQKFLFGKKDPVTGSFQLWVYNITSGEVKNLGLFTTPDKAVWDSDSNIIYASVPNSGAQSPAAGNSLTADTFFRINTSTLEKKQYASSGTTAIDGRDLFLNSLGDKLFFRNAQDGGLYYLDLSK